MRNPEKKTLLDAGMGNCDVAVVGIGDILTLPFDHADAGFHGDSQGHCQGDQYRARADSEKLGAEVVYPERDMAIRLAHRPETSQALDFVQLSEKINISKFALPAQAVGQTVVEVNLRNRFGLNIIAIENGGVVEEAVRPDYIFRTGDILYLSGSKEGFNKLAAWVNG